jgi:phosphomannomutase
VNATERARQWIERDPDPDTQRELRALLESGDEDAIAARFEGQLEFGTAGLRGLLGAGPTRMNRVTVAHATAGLCAWLKQQVPDAERRGICVGRDARDKSDVFERDVVEVATAAGFRVLRFTDVVPTPVVAFSVRETGAAAGVVITASHNPPGYSGYKVYWENGAQIIPPNDEGIARSIADASRTETPRRDFDEARETGLVDDIDALRARYVERIAQVAQPTRERRELRIAYTALHGVAEVTMREAFAAAGFTDVASVAAQAEPDGRFPTVAFPNPEEPGAMERVLALAEERGADLVIANDPDGDRVAAAARGRNGFEVLSGNELGLLLADDLLRDSNAANPLVLSTVVSSPALGAIADRYGARWEQTLTGHKWLQNRALELEALGYTYVFSYEEALGYACSAAVRDKDGISAALRLADIAARQKADAATLLDRRASLWTQHGVALDRQVSVRFDGPDAKRSMSATVGRLRESPPREIGGRRVTSVRDLERQTVLADGTESPNTSLPKSNVLIFELEDGCQIMVRPSGTEPKLKYYFYATAKVGGRGLEPARREAMSALDEMAADLASPSE